jgi:hypothetical protein
MGKISRRHLSFIIRTFRVRLERLQQAAIFLAPKQKLAKHEGINDYDEGEEDAYARNPVANQE